MKIRHFRKNLSFSAQLLHFDHKSSGFGRLSKKIEDLVEKKMMLKKWLFFQIFWDFCNSMTSRVSQGHQIGN